MKKALARQPIRGPIRVRSSVIVPSPHALLCVQVEVVLLDGERLPRVRKGVVLQEYCQCHLKVKSTVIKPSKPPPSKLKAKLFKCRLVRCQNNRDCSNESTSKRGSSLPLPSRRAPIRTRSRLKTIPIFRPEWSHHECTILIVRTHQAPRESRRSEVFLAN